MTDFVELQAASCVVTDAACTTVDNVDFDYVIDHLIAPNMSPEQELIWAEELLESFEIEHELDTVELIALDLYLKSE